jgi:hypothetical protein
VVDRGSVQAERRFYVVAAYTMLILTAVGFQNFYLYGRAPWGEMTAAIVPLIVAHGLAMSGWVILLCLQSTLILMGRRQLHMVIGPAGAVLAAALVILGSTVAALSVHYNPQIYGPFGGARFFLVVMLTQMVVFGALVAIGIANRRRAEIHRPMMLLATLVILSGSLGRVPYVANLAVLPPLYAYTPTLLFGALLFLVHWGMTRLTNRWYLVGYAGFVLASFASVGLGNTELWNQMVGTFVP